MAFQVKSYCFEYIYFTPLLLVFTILPLTALISSVIYVIVYLVSCLFPNYGQFLSCTDVLLDEDFITSTPESSIVISLILKENISLEKLRFHFTQNVLNARSKVNAHKLRYSKLKQYLTTFMCFRIWKNDLKFQVNNHISEEFWNGTDLPHIHQKYLNKSYRNRRSPWELILIRNVNFDEISKKELKSLVVFKVHHVLGDGKSMLKLLVECLGNKQVKTASPRNIQETRWDKLQFLLRFPFKYISESGRLMRLLHDSFDHPWNLKSWRVKSSSKTNETVVAFTSDLSLSNLKNIAKRNNVRTSAVVISIIAGAIRKLCGKNWDKEVAIFLSLPKPNHPDYLTNHLDSSILRLPTDQQCELKRLVECNQEFNQISDEHKERYAIVARWLVGLQIYPINRFFGNALVPTGITNNAGEKEGFSVGSVECIDCRASVGTLRGPTGVTFCGVSYMDKMIISVIAKESILSKTNAKTLAKCVEHELELLMENAKIL